jgi:hypothetical protein
MTSTYLHSQGFAPAMPHEHPTLQTFSRAWRYRHTCQAQDGSYLYAEHPLGINNCRLSALPAPLDEHDVAATVGLHDRPAFEAAVASFFTAHGGLGEVLTGPTPASFRPYRRQE